MISVPRHASRGWRALVALLASGLVLSACADRAHSTLNVSAASSLSDAFTEMALAYEAAHPGVDVVLNLGGSSLLASQIAEGAPIDVFAPADPGVLRIVSDSGVVTSTPVVFASNLATIGVPQGNPGGVNSLVDLESVSFLGVCAPVVPCGRLAEQVFEKAGIDPDPVTEAPNVRALVAKIESGDLDAGIVYETDVRSANIDSVPIPEDFEATTDYPIVTIGHGEPRTAGADFVSFVLSGEGQAILSGHGFSAR